MSECHDRRTFLKGSAAAILGTAIDSSALARPASKRKRNVLLVTSDQETALLPARLNLPNRAKLLSRGATFQTAFCCLPQCSPGRASILTGLEPLHNGVLANLDPGSPGVPPSTELATLGSVFRAAGYATGYFGKWHLGSPGPEAHGFTKSEVTRFQNSGAQSDPATARLAAEWIAVQRDPWFAWVSLINPHDVYFPPYGFGEDTIHAGVTSPFSDISNLASKPQEQMDYAQLEHAFTGSFNERERLQYRSRYCDLVQNVDEQLGQILNAIPDLGSAIVAYSSDHGDELGEHGLPFKGPFMYDEEIRIPLVIVAPDTRLRPGVRSDLVQQTDILPTLAALAAVPIPDGLDGRDLSQGVSGRDAVFLDYAGYHGQGPVWELTPIRTVRTVDWKLNWYDRSGHKELYDLRNDPHELHNLAGEANVRNIQSQLESRLNKHHGPLTQIVKEQPGRYLNLRSNNCKSEKGQSRC